MEKLKTDRRKLILGVSTLSSETNPAKSKGARKDNAETDKKKEIGLEKYQREMDLLSDTLRSADSVWEERVYQIAAGALSLCMAAFTFLAGMDKGFSLDWRGCMIMLVYVVVILINFMSQRLTVRNCEALMNKINDLVSLKIPFDRKALQASYDKKNLKVRLIYWIESALLLADVVCTIVYLWSSLN